MKVGIFPTMFAESLGEECGLMIKHGPGINYEKYLKRNLMMESFQQMAMAVPFDDCLIVFHGVKLSKKHLEILAVIHKSTRPWALGNAAAIMLDKLEGSMLSGKDAKDITLALVEYLNPTEGEKGSQGGNGPRGYHVHLHPPE